MPLTFDGVGRVIQLDGAPTVSIRSLYSRWVDWVALSDNSKYLPAFSVIADPPAVPVYATLLNGWLVRPSPGLYTLTLNDGFLYTSSGGDPLATTTGVEPRIRYQNPVIAVGYSTASPQQPDIDTIKAATAKIYNILDIVEADEVHVSGTIQKRRKGTATVLLSKVHSGTPLQNFLAVDP